MIRERLDHLAWRPARGPPARPRSSSTIAQQGLELLLRLVAACSSRRNRSARLRRFATFDGSSAATRFSSSKALLLQALLGADRDRFLELAEGRRSSAPCAGSDRQARCAPRDSSHRSSGSACRSRRPSRRSRPSRTATRPASTPRSRPAGSPRLRCRSPELEPGVRVLRLGGEVLQVLLERLVVGALLDVLLRALERLAFAQESQGPVLSGARVPRAPLRSSREVGSSLRKTIGGNRRFFLASPCGRTRARRVHRDVRAHRQRSRAHCMLSMTDNSATSKRRAHAADSKCTHDAHVATRSTQSRPAPGAADPGPSPRSARYQPRSSASRIEPCWSRPQTRPPLGAAHQLAGVPSSISVPVARFEKHTGLRSALPPPRGCGSTASTHGIAQSVEQRRRGSSRGSRTRPAGRPAPRRRGAVTA